MIANNALQPAKLGLSAAISVAIIWSVTALLGNLMFATMMRPGGWMADGEATAGYMGGYQGHMSGAGAFIPGLVMSIVIGLVVWLAAVIYKRLAA